MDPGLLTALGAERNEEPKHRTISVAEAAKESTDKSARKIIARLAVINTP